MSRAQIPLSHRRKLHGWRTPRRKAPALQWRGMATEFEASQRRREFRQMVVIVAGVIIFLAAAVLIALVLGRLG